MATYVGRYRTNYFSVTNEDTFSEWLEQYVNGADKIVKDHKGGFSGYGTFSFHGPFEEEVDEYEALRKLQELLADGDACVIKEVGYEKFRYLNSVVTIITQNEYKSLDLDSFLTREVQEMLHNSNFTVDLTY